MDVVEKVSYLCDPIGDIVKAGLAISVGGIAEICLDLDQGGERYVLDYCPGDEPPRALRLRRFSFAELWDPRPSTDGDLSFEAKISDYNEFAKAALVLGDDVMRQHGEAGFAALWDPHRIAFPRRALAALRAALSLSNLELISYPYEEDEDD